MAVAMVAKQAGVSGLDALRPVEAMVVNVSNEYESAHSFFQKAAISIFHNIRDGLRR